MTERRCEMEIGSEFWKDGERIIQENEELFLSGRTALDAIIKDVLEEHEISSALLPSYCCHTMIEPFFRNGILVRFYDMFINDNGRLETKIPEPKENEIFYDMKYFGSNTIIRTGVSDLEIQKLWDVVIEDTTHSCFHGTHRFKADYEFTSCRKWMAFDGIAIARKQRGVFHAKPQNWTINKAYCASRNQAFAMKNAYMLGESVDKIEFLHIFGKAEEYLSKQYVDFRPDINTVVQYYMEMQKMDTIRKIRLKNARQLVDGLKDIQNVTILVDVDEPEICPLFVAIAIEPVLRNPLRQHLVEHEIYCPVHWPLSFAHKGISPCAKKIYQRELSLICDQRYGEKDMERILETIREFFVRIKE